MDWDDLRFVLATARSGTLVGAASSLGVTHTTVSRRLRSLEDALGVSLFDRTLEGWVPTAAGLDLVDTAARMQDEVLSLERRVMGRDSRLTGALEVTAPDVLAERYVADFNSFAGRYPGIELNISVDNNIRNLSRREADVAIRITNHPDDYLVGRKVGQVTYAVFGSRERVDRVGAEAPISSYPRVGLHRWISDPDTEAWMARHVPDVRIVYRVNNELVMRNAVRCGTGLAHLMCVDADSDPGLVRMCPVIPDFGYDLWLLTHPDLRGSARVRAFMDHMATSIVAQREAMTGKLGANQPRARRRVLA